MRENTSTRSNSSTARTLGRTAATLMTAGMIIGTSIFRALCATGEHAGSALMLVIVSLLGVFVFLVARHVEPAHLVPTLDKGPLEFMTGAAIFFWAWDAFMRTAIMASEMKDPRRTIPFSILGGIAIAAVVFYAVAATTLGVLGAQEIAKDDVPLFKAAVQAIGPSGGWLILAAAWAASLSELVSDLLSVSRVALAMGEAHELPRWFGEVHPRFKVPRHAVLAIGVFVFAVVLVFDLRQVLPLASFYLLVWFAITHYSALQLTKEQRLFSRFFSWFGLAGCFVLLFFIPPFALIIGVVALVVALGARFIVRR